MSTPINVGPRGQDTVTASGSYDPVTVGTYGELDISGANVAVTLADISLDEATIGVLNHATATIESVTSNNFGGFNIGTGATLEEGASLKALQPATFLTADGTLRIDPTGETLSTGFVTLFRQGDTIALASSVTSFVYTPATFGNEGTLVLDHGATMLATLDMNGIYTQDSFVINPDGTLGIACFASGTRIATDRGEVVVDDLVVGDRVWAQLAAASLPVIWVGRRRIDCRNHPNPQAVWPVRVAANAFGPNLPVRDLFLSPDHAVYINDVLIAVRCLINGGSIVQTPVPAVVYYHIEVEHHDVLQAEGLAVESYLNNGHHAAMFGDVAAMHPDGQTSDQASDRASASCVPFATDAATIAPVWRRLAERAHQIGLAPTNTPTTQDAELRLQVDGCDIPPDEIDGDRYVFLIPQVNEAVLVSRTARPCDARPWLDDRRQLGVNVRRIRVDHAVEIPLDHPALMRGWWATDAGEQCRWTDGAASLPLPAGSGRVEIWLGGRLEYPVAAAQQLRVA